MKKMLIALLTIFFMFTFETCDAKTGYLKDLNVLVNGSEASELKDDNYNTHISIGTTDTIKVSSSIPITGLYIVYNIDSAIGDIYYNGSHIMIGDKGFLHEYINIASTRELEITYKNGADLKEIYAFAGSIPDWVQKWNPPYEDADLLLFSAHSDDEHLYFAGLIPTMVNAGKKVEVVYVVDHSNNPIRLDERLDGLWTAGIKNYPLLGNVPDKLSSSLGAAIANLSMGNLTTDDVIKFEVDAIRRFKPEVVVTHDENGEYGHGQHRLTTYALKEALKVVDDKNYVTDYEPFMPYKAYIHLYGQNKITMDYDTPLAYFDGKTAYEVSGDAFAMHVSQLKSWFVKWYYGENYSYKTMKEIKTYNPMYYGLYYSAVGYENVNNDMFYNIPEPEVLDEVVINEVEIQKRSADEKRNGNLYGTAYMIGVYIIEALIIGICATAIIKGRG